MRITDDLLEKWLLHRCGERQMTPDEAREFDDFRAAAVAVAKEAGAASAPPVGGAQ